MSHFSTLDAYDVAPDLDFLAWDSYPTGFVQDRRAGELTWVMEQQSGGVNWPPYGA